MPNNSGPILIVAAHPDDEVIGAGIQMTRWDRSRIMIVHLTDGAPRNHPDREEYAHERRRELYCALDLAGLRPDQCMEFRYVDQEAYLNLVECTGRLVALIQNLQPSIVYTHPYEGGHPDHDAAAFAVAHAAEGPVMEFTSYHMGPQGMLTGRFLAEGETETVEPSESERMLKERMFQCFRSQQEVLTHFPVGPEKFRPAPAYDFTNPPHPGTLHYETLGWNISGPQWREKASEALQLLPRRNVL